jgi:hypothetical protein
MRNGETKKESKTAGQRVRERRQATTGMAPARPIASGAADAAAA